MFFHDEAVSFAPGHRPCATCRRPAYRAFQAAWSAALGVEPPLAWEMNRQLHRERIVRGTHGRRLHALPWPSLPDGVFVLGDAPSVVLGGSLVEWTREGYDGRVPRPARGDAVVITPPSTVAVLATGYPVQIDAAAYRAVS